MELARGRRTRLTLHVGWRLNLVSNQDIIDRWIAFTVIQSFLRQRMDDLTPLLDSRHVGLQFLNVPDREKISSREERGCQRTQKEYCDKNCSEWVLLHKS